MENILNSKNKNLKFLESVNNHLSYNKLDNVLYPKNNTAPVFSVLFADRVIFNALAFDIFTDLVDWILKIKLPNLVRQYFYNNVLYYVILKCFLINT